MNAQRHALYCAVACLGLSTAPLGRAVPICADDHGNGGGQPGVASETQVIEIPGTSIWRIQEADSAVEGYRAILGAGEFNTEKVNAALVILKEDKTPYLSEQIVQRPVWQVTVKEWSVKVPSLPEGVVDRFVRTLDVYIDPVDGNLLKLETRWPEGEPPLGPPISAETAVKQMRRSNNQVYHGFPSEPPKVTFLDALNSIILHAGAQPTVARQIIAHHVVWSTTSREPRAVWAITLRGIPPYFLRGRASSNEPKFQLRYLVDAMTGKFLGSSNAPGPVEPERTANGKPRRKGD